MFSRQLDICKGEIYLVRTNTLLRQQGFRARTFQVYNTHTHTRRDKQLRMLSYVFIDGLWLPSFAVHTLRLLVYKWIICIQLLTSTSPPGDYHDTPCCISVSSRENSEKSTCHAVAIPMSTPISSVTVSCVLCAMLVPVANRTCAHVTRTFRTTRSVSQYKNGFRIGLRRYFHLPQIQLSRTTRHRKRQDHWRGRRRHVWPRQDCASTTPARVLQAVLASSQGKQSAEEIPNTPPYARGDHD